MWDALWAVLSSELSLISGVEKYTNQAFGTEQMPYYGSYMPPHKRVDITWNKTLHI